MNHEFLFFFANSGLVHKSVMVSSIIYRHVYLLSSFVKRVLTVKHIVIIIIKRNKIIIFIIKIFLIKVIHVAFYNSDNKTDFIDFHVYITPEQKKVAYSVLFGQDVDCILL